MRDIWFQQVLVTHPKHVFVYDFHTLFFNLACFWYPKRYTRVHRLVLKNDPNYVNFFTRMISTLKYKCPPPRDLKGSFKWLRVFCFCFVFVLFCFVLFWFFLRPALYTSSVSLNNVSAGEGSRGYLKHFITWNVNLGTCPLRQRHSERGLWVKIYSSGFTHKRASFGDNLA